MPQCHGWIKIISPDEWKSGPIFFFAIRHIYSGALTLIQEFSAPFSWRLLIPAVCRITSGVTSLLWEFRRFNSWTKTAAQQADADTPTTQSSPKLWQCAQLFLTACTIGSALFELFSTEFGWIHQLWSCFQSPADCKRPMLSSKTWMCREIHPIASYFEIK